MDEADLVRVHEARVAHHVAAVGQIDRQDRAAAVLDGAAAVVVQLLVVVGADVAARKDVFEVLEERRVVRHDVFEVPVQRAVLDHQDLAVALDDGRLDLADLLVEQDLVVALAVEDFLSGLAHAHRAERVGLARPAERRLHLLVRLLQRQVGPLRRERVAWLDAVERVERHPGALGDVGQALLDVLDRLVHGAHRNGFGRPRQPNFRSTGRCRGSTGGRRPGRPARRSKAAKRQRRGRLRRGRQASAGTATGGEMPAAQPRMAA